MISYIMTVFKNKKYKPQMEIIISILTKLEEKSIRVQEAFSFISDIVAFMTQHLWCIAIAPRNGSAMEEETLLEGKCRTSY